MSTRHTPDQPPRPWPFPVRETPEPAPAPTPEPMPKCDKCGVPITTGMLAMMCPHGRACALVDDDEHWITVEEFRQALSIERHPGATPKPKGDE